jgi:arginyl-tRNA synthetase
LQASDVVGVSTGSDSDRVASGPLAAARDLITSQQEPVKKVLSGETGDEIWSLLVLAARLEESNAQAAVSAEPAVLAKYAFNLAKAFNLFYHRHRIIAEEDEVKRAVLITIADYARQQLIKALGTLGISVPERM